MATLALIVRGRPGAGAQEDHPHEPGERPNVRHVAASISTIDRYITTTGCHGTRQEVGEMERIFLWLVRLPPCVPEFAVPREP